MRMHQKPFARKKFETANIERKRQIDDDTVELVRLAKELNDSIEGTDRNARPGDIMVKAELIEKLAHSVKEKMKLTVNGN